MKKSWLWALIVVAAAFAASAGVTAASSGRPAFPKTAGLKAPLGTVAKVRGLRYAYGNVVTSYPSYAAGGVIVPAVSVAVCPRGLHALGGGWNSDDTTTDRITISSNTVGRGLNRWIVVAEDTANATIDYTPTDFTFEAVVMCG